MGTGCNPALLASPSLGPPRSGPPALLPSPSGWVGLGPPPPIWDPCPARIHPEKTPCGAPFPVELGGTHVSPPSGLA